MSLTLLPAERQWRTLGINIVINIVCGHRHNTCLVCNIAMTFKVVCMHNTCKILGKMLYIYTYLPSSCGKGETLIGKDKKHYEDAVWCSKSSPQGCISKSFQQDSINTCKKPLRLILNKEVYLWDSKGSICREVICWNKLVHTDVQDFQQ